MIGHAELASNMETKIKEREEELRLALSEELEVERARLRDAGISETDIRSRLQALETQKASEHDQQMESFKLETEAERRQIEDNLKQLQDEYNRDLQQFGSERDELLASSKKKEEDLKSQLRQQEQALRTQQTEAETRIRRIAEQKEKEDLVDTQLIGFYGSVKQNLQDERYDRAIQNLESIRSYLNEESIITLPSVQKRREVEFFVIDSLSQLMENEIAKANVDSSNLLQSANVKVPAQS